jgi:predicted DNA-binding transcriptional regulator AlpA
MGIKQTQVLEMIKVSRTTLWRMIKTGDFPEPNRENARLLFWTQEQVENWSEALN